jgi:PmbA protein
VGTLLDRGFTQVELYRKQGRSRHLQYGLEGMSSVVSDEQGWAVRAGDHRHSFFGAGTGCARSAGPWPAARGAALRLPEVQPAPEWTPPSDLHAPLIGETEGFSLFKGLAAALEQEIPGATLVRAVLQDGFSEVELLNSRGVQADWRIRVADLRLEAVLRDDSRARAALYLAAREARHFNPAVLARRLADRLAVTQRGRAPSRDRGELLLAPEVMARLLVGLLPLFCDSGARHKLARLRDRRDRIASQYCTLIDDGRFPGGVLSAPVDGEGVPTRRVVLVEEGGLRQTLQPWWEAQGRAGRPPGCQRRSSWRSPPRTSPSHLYLEAEATTPVARLLASVSRGYYFIDATLPGQVDLEAGRFALPVCGFAIHGGQAAAPVAGAWLRGSIATLLHGLQAVARDLTFLPLGGAMIGSPTVLVTGLEVRDSAS